MSPSTPAPLAAILLRCILGPPRAATAQGAPGAPAGQGWVLLGCPGPAEQGCLKAGGGGGAGCPYRSRPPSGSGGTWAWCRLGARLGCGMLGARTAGVTARGPRPGPPRCGPGPDVRSRPQLEAPAPGAVPQPSHRCALCFPNPFHPLHPPRPLCLAPLPLLHACTPHILHPLHPLHPTFYTLRRRAPSSPPALVLWNR